MSRNKSQRAKLRAYLAEHSASRKPGAAHDGLNPHLDHLETKRAIASQIAQAIAEKQTQQGDTRDR